MSDTQPSTTFLPSFSQEGLPYVTPFALMHQRIFYGSTSQATQVRQPLSRS